MNHSSSNQRKSSGFTLIELLTVISIIGVITTVVTVNLAGARKQARDVRRKTDVQTLLKAVELYANAHGGKVPQASAGVVSTATNPWIPGITEYVSNPPVDPTNQAPHVYSYQTGSGKFQQNYTIESVLEAEAQENANLTNVSQDPANEAYYITGMYWDNTLKLMKYRVSSGR